MYGGDGEQEYNLPPPSPPEEEAKLPPPTMMGNLENARNLILSAFTIML